MRSLPAPPDERVLGAAADEHVVRAAAGDVLDVGAHVVALAGRAVVGAAGERHADGGHAVARSRPRSRPAPPASTSGPSAADEAVVAAAAVERVRARAAGEVVAAAPPMTFSTSARSRSPVMPSSADVVERHDDRLGRVE